MTCSNRAVEIERKFKGHYKSLAKQFSEAGKVSIDNVKRLVRLILQAYKFDPFGIALKSRKIVSLSTEASFVAKLIEQDLLEKIAPPFGAQGARVEHGGERTYPDLDIHIPTPKGEIVVALDIKCASVSGDRMRSRLTLYTFGTYLKYRDRRQAGILRSYDSYTVHLDLVALYTIAEPSRRLIASNMLELDEKKLLEAYGRGKIFENLRFCLVEPWRVSSHVPSSGTRDYVGAVQYVNDFIREQGVFRSKQAFLEFWARVPARNTKLRQKVCGGRKQPPSTAYVEHLAALLGIDARKLARKIIDDQAFPCFTKDRSANQYKRLEGIKSATPFFVYPRIALEYIKDHLTYGISVDSEKMETAEENLTELLKQKE